MEYKELVLEDSIRIEAIYSIHYFEYTKTFSYPGESHNFWEFICADIGNVSVISGSDTFVLEAGNIFFHQPNEFHNIEILDDIPPNLVVISFRSNSKLMDFFIKRLLSIDEVERALLADIIREAGQCFSTPLHDPYVECLHLSETAPLGGQQVIRNKLELFLLSLVRKIQLSPTIYNSRKKTIKKTYDELLYQRILLYMQQHLQEKLTIQSICTRHNIGATRLQTLFHAQTGLSAMDYFNQLKIDEIKSLIRTEMFNFSQIAEKMGFSSIHYFSKFFKRYSGQTPTEYSTSIKALIEKNNS